MRSTFIGLETAKRGLYAQQGALYTTGHNISNANTLGFSRQRVNMTASNAYPVPGTNRPETPGQLGTGVDSSSIQRYRDEFVDYQFRQQNQSMGYWQSRAESLSRMEEIMNEPSDNGLSKVMNEFWGSLEDLSLHPDEEGARAVVIQRGNAVADTFNYLHSRLTLNKNDVGASLDQSNSQVNTLINQINAINEKIASVEPNGYMPNDLYDQRDLLVDELSGYVNIKVDRVSSGGLSPAMAEGKYTVRLLDAQNRPIGTLVDGNTLSANPLRVNLNDAGTGVASVNVGNETLALDKFTSPGKMQAQMEAFGKADATNPDQVTGLYDDMLAKLDDMAFTFANAFNDVHKAGWSLEEINAGQKVNGTDSYAFFDEASIATRENAAANLKVSDLIVGFTNRIAAAQPTASGQAFAGDGKNALALAEVKDTQLAFNGKVTTTETFYQGVIGAMGVEASEANRQMANTVVLVDSVQKTRDSISSVSLDEEMTNMIKFQQAYNASARTITMVDEMLDRIINGMGLVGR